MFHHKKDIFFDLDHTIWDFDKNAEETLYELYPKYGFNKLFDRENPDLFIEVYTTNNHKVWDLYHRGIIDKATLRKLRFANTFSELGVDPSLFPAAFEEEYLTVCPTKTNLFPDAHETLQYLQKKYHLHLISNGFREACEKKLQHSKLANYFKTIVISEIFGVNKPDRRIFEHALTNGKTNKDDAVMIGDNIDADIRGAMAVGMDAIYFNPTGAARPADVRYMVIDLKELQHIF